MCNQIVDEARSWKDTKFQHQARVKGVGCDCVGLIIGVRKALKISDFDTMAYSKIPDGKVLKDMCDEHMRPIAFDELEFGDVILFKFKDKPQHLAIVGNHPHGGFSIIHAYSVSRKVVESSLDKTWLDRIVCCYKLNKGAA